MLYKKSYITLLALIVISFIAIGCSDRTQPDKTNWPDEVDWQTAVEIINTGQVTEVFQTHNLQVTLTLADGRQIKTVEPFIDDIFREVELCGDPCSNIIMVTE